MEAEAAGKPVAGNDAPTSCVPLEVGMLALVVLFFFRNVFPGTNRELGLALGV